MSEQDCILKLKDVTKIYDAKTEHPVNALAGVSLDIRRGEMLAVMGVSGSGKSTLLHILGTLDSATQGSVIFDGEDLTTQGSEKLAKIRNGKIGFVLQDYGLLTGENVLFNVKLPLIFNDKLKSKDINAAVSAALEKVEMGGYEKRKASKLSGGQKQRVGIARAIVNDPILLLADEPTGALDGQTAESIVDLFRTLSDKGITVVMVTHDPKMADKFDRIIYIDYGKIVSEKVLRPAAHDDTNV